jgi:hypothetical protein
MNLGLFACGLDLMPELGYPAVQFGGWLSPLARWAGMTASHNTVVVDGEKEQYPTYSGIVGGQTSLWAMGHGFQAVRASGPAINGCARYERGVAVIETSPQDFYLIDIFQVSGGHDHARFQHSHFGTITTQGMDLQPAADFGHDTQMRNFACDAAPRPGWSVDWKVDDHYKLLPRGADVHLRYTDLTHGASASVCEGWVVGGIYDTGGEVKLIPRVMTRRSNTPETEPLISTFVGVIEPYETGSRIKSIRRLALFDRNGLEYPDSYVALELELTDGRRDLLVAVDAEDQSRGDQAVVQPEWGLATDGEWSHVRLGTDGNVERLSLCHGKFVQVGEHRSGGDEHVDFAEWDFRH